MADPITMMMAVGTVATIAGGATTAYGQVQQGKAGQQMYDYRAAVAQQNALYEREVGERQAGIAGMKERAQAGQILAAQGASGLSVSGDSAREVRESQHALGLITQEDIRLGAERKAFGEETQADIDRAAGRGVRFAGDLGAFGTALSTTGTVASRWYQASNLGMTTRSPLFGT